MEQWEKIQKHCEEVWKILVQNGATDSHGCIRKWNDKIYMALKNAGHTSLSNEKCVCCK
jgi:hypothetical protein